MSIGYIKNFLQDKDVGSVTPTSQVCIERVCEKMDLPNSSCVVEFGPGGGCFTRYILKKIPESAKLVAIEKNPNFVTALNKDPTLQDPRFHLVNDSVTNSLDILHKLDCGPVDSIISGVPFAMFDDELRKKIISEANSILKPGGKFLIYQFYPPITWKGKKLEDYLNEQMEVVEMSLHLPNIPPLRIYEVVKVR